MKIGPNRPSRNEGKRLLELASLIIFGSLPGLAVSAVDGRSKRGQRGDSVDSPRFREGAALMASAFLTGEPQFGRGLMEKLELSESVVYPKLREWTESKWIRPTAAPANAGDSRISARWFVITAAGQRSLGAGYEIWAARDKKRRKVVNRPLTT